MEKHVMRILGPKIGDEKIEWDPGDDKSIATAREKFTEKIKQGFKAFKIQRETVERQGDPITDFDPSLKEILLVPAMSGG